MIEQQVKKNPITTSHVKILAIESPTKIYKRNNKKTRTTKSTLNTAYLTCQNNSKPIRVNLTNLIAQPKFPMKKQNTLNMSKGIKEYRAKPKIETTEEVHLPKLPTPKFMSIVNPLDISFGADKVTVQNDNKAFHKMKTYHPYENTCNTSNNMNMLTETETNGNIIKIINAPLKQYNKTKTFTHKTRKKHHNDGSLSPNKLFPKYPSVKYSSHEVGNYIKSYAVNSYQGLFKLTNEDKVSLILSITKPKGFKREWPQCSYLAIYEGYNGSRCSDFLRDNLHQYIIKSSSFPTDPKESLVLGLRNAESDYYDKYISKAGAYVIVSLIINHVLYTCTLGKCKSIVSLNNGTSFNILHKESQCDNEDKDYFGESVDEVSSTGIEDIMPTITKTKIDNNNIDFLMMGSEGLFETVSEKECFEIIWEFVNTMKRRYETFHSLSGAIVDRLIKIAVKRGSKHSVTCVFIGFENYENRYNEGINILKGSDGILSLNYIRKPILKLKLTSS